MKHPSSETLALLAGEDLSMMEAIQTRWHLRGCSVCRVEVEALSRSILILREEALELPIGLDWESLSAEMRGNINVGLEASQAISSFSNSKPAPLLFDWRPVVAMAAVTIVGATGWYLSNQKAERINNPSVLLQANADGIEWKHGDLSLSFRNRSEERSVIAVDTKGVASSRYVDSETGQVAITNVYLD